MTVLFVTNHVPPDRRGAFAELHARVPIELALFGGRSHHATAGVEDPGVPHRHVEQRELFALAAGGEYRAVVCGTAGRVALPASYAGARRAGVPFVLWSALWAQPRSPAHAAGALLLQRIYADADAVVAYGPHVAAHARRRGARRVFTAPQAVDQEFWTQPGGAMAQPGRAASRANDDATRTADGSCPPGEATDGVSGSAGRSSPPGAGTTTFLFVGRPAPGKGVDELLAAWSAAGLAQQARLVLVGVEPDVRRSEGVSTHPPAEAAVLRNFYAAADVLVVPSVPTRTFREPWGLVCNEAMHQGLPIIATDAVGAAAGGLVRHERNGLVVAAHDPGALAGALRRLHEEPSLRRRMGTQGRRDAAAFSFEAWADGMAAALEPDRSRRMS